VLPAIAARVVLTVSVEASTAADVTGGRLGHVVEATAGVAWLGIVQHSLTTHLRTNTIL